MEALDLLVRLQVQGSEAIRQANQMQRSLQGVTDSAQSSARAIQMVDRGASTMGRAFASNRSLLSNFGQQMQDIIIVSQGGARSLGQVGIQVGQIVSAFGPFGTVLGVAATVLGFVAAGLIAGGKGGDAFADATERLRDVLDKTTAYAEALREPILALIEDFGRYADEIRKLQEFSGQLGLDVQVDEGKRAFEQLIAAADEYLVKSNNLFMLWERGQTMQFPMELMSEEQRRAVADTAREMEKIRDVRESLARLRSMDVSDVEGRIAEGERLVRMLQELEVVTADVALNLVDRLQVIAESGAAAEQLEAALAGAARAGEALARSAASAYAEYYRTRVEAEGLATAAARAAGASIVQMRQQLATRAGDLQFNIDTSGLSTFDRTLQGVNRQIDQWRDQQLAAENVTSETRAQITAAAEEFRGYATSIAASEAALEKLRQTSAASSGGGGGGGGVAEGASARMAEFVAELRIAVERQEALTAAALRGAQAYEDLRRSQAVSVAGRQAVEEFRELAERVGMSADEIARAEAEVRRLGEAAAEAAQGLDKALRFALEPLDDRLNDEFVGQMREVVGLFMEGRLQFEEFASSFLKRISVMIAEATVFRALAAAFGASGGPFAGLSNLIYSAKGNAFANGDVVALAKGGIVNGPTPFAMRSGLGVMGEAGPEAVMPLMRTGSGALGVAAAPVNVTIVNETGAKIDVAENVGEDGGRNLEIRVMNVVRQGLASGEFDKALGMSFGVKRRGY